MRLLVVLALLATLARAELGPSFYVDGLTWRATHIVIVRTNGEGGKVETIESLLGDFAPGETVPVEGLAKYHGRRTHELGRGPRTAITGARVLLFLRRTGGTWEPADEHGGLHVSAAWIEGERVYANRQVLRPGPAVLTSLGATEKELRARIEALLDARARLARIAKEPDAERRATRAAAYVGSDYWPAHRRAIEILEGCGPAAARTLRGILADPLRAENHESVIEVMGRTGGPGVAEDLTALLARQLEFWKKTAPELKRGWWNDLGPDCRRLRREYGIAHATLRALKRLRHGPCRETVTAFRDYWRSLPQLHDPSGLDQMTKAADAVLKSLDAK
jgi:hypothetical protein